MAKLTATDLWASIEAGNIPAAPAPRPKGAPSAKMNANKKPLPHAKWFNRKFVFITQLYRCTTCGHHWTGDGKLFLESISVDTAQPVFRLKAIERADAERLAERRRARHSPLRLTRKAQNHAVNCCANCVTGILEPKLPAVVLQPADLFHNEEDS